MLTCLPILPFFSFFFLTMGSGVERLLLYSCILSEFRGRRAFRTFLSSVVRFIRIQVIRIQVLASVSHVSLLCSAF